MYRHHTILGVVLTCLVFLMTTASAQNRAVFKVAWRINEPVAYDVYVDESKKSPEEIVDKAFKSLVLGPQTLLTHPIFNGFMPNPRLEWSHIANSKEYNHYISFDIVSGKTIDQIYDEVDQASKSDAAYETLNNILVEQGYFEVTRITFTKTNLMECVDADRTKNSCGKDCFPCLSGAACTANADCAFKCAEGVCLDYSSASMLFSTVALVLTVIVGCLSIF